MHIGYDTQIVLDGDKKEALRTIFKGRTILLGEVLPGWEKEYKLRFPYEREFYLAVREKKELERDYYECRFIICLGDRNSELGKPYSMQKFEDVTSKNPINSVTELDEATAISFVAGKELLYRVHYVERFGNVEETIRTKFCNYILLMGKKEKLKSQLLYDDFYDVRLFLKQIDGTMKETVHKLTPIDVRSFDINKEILTFLEDESREYFYVPEEDYFVDVSVVSRELQAQYFFTSFHSNPSWSLNPICQLRFRISAFVIPGMTDMDIANKKPNNSFAVNTKTHEKYEIDSIHFNSDIFENFEEFKEVVGFHFYEICLA